MLEARIDQILKQLGSHHADAAWGLFLDEYAPLIFQVIRHFESDADNAADCFQSVCKRLCEDRFRRLRRFKPEGAAKFSTWLRAVVRNLSLDWQRQQFGRRRVFRSVARLSDLDQQVFRLVHEHGASEQEALVSLGPKFPHLTTELLSEAIGRVNSALTRNQSWLLRMRSRFAGRRHTDGSESHEPAEAVAHSLTPEMQAIVSETRVMLNRALRGLSNGDRLLVRLRFEEELTLEEIAKLLDLGNAQRVDRQIKQILSILRVQMISTRTSDIAGKNSASSVKAG